MFACSRFNDEVNVVFSKISFDEEVLCQLAGFFNELRIIIR